MQIEEGKEYITRNGSVVMITNYMAGMPYPIQGTFKSEIGYPEQVFLMWQENGRSIADNIDSDLDIIEEYYEPVKTFKHGDIIEDDNDIVDNQHKNIKGYRDLTRTEINFMNEIKAQGEYLNLLVEKLQNTPGLDQRWVSIGKTDCQTGLMALVRAVAQPESF